MNETWTLPKGSTVVGGEYKFDARAIFDYDLAAKERVEACNLCGSKVYSGANYVERYGFGRAVWCSDCGLIYLNPRLTRESYAIFYEKAYRALVSGYHGRPINHETIRKEQHEYGNRLKTILRPWITKDIPHVKAIDVLDIGGSTGEVWRAITWGVYAKVTVLDPSPDELAKAREVLPEEFGHSHVRGQIEDYEPWGKRFDVVTMCQTADHLLDLMGSLKKIRGLLSEGGLFWSDIVNFDKTQEVKIDHPFNLTEKTYREFLRRAGFELLQVNYAEDGVHVGFLCRVAA